MCFITVTTLIYSFENYVIGVFSYTLFLHYNILGLFSTSTQCKSGHIIMEQIFRFKLIEVIADQHGQVDFRAVTVFGKPRPAGAVYGFLSQRH